MIKCIKKTFYLFIEPIDYLSYQQFFTSCPIILRKSIYIYLPYTAERGAQKDDMTHNNEHTELLTTKC